MKLVKKSGEFSIFQKRSGRYGVKNSAGKWVNGAEKIKVLVGEKLIKTAIPAKDPDPPPAKEAEEQPAAEASEQE